MPLHSRTIPTPPPHHSTPPPLHHHPTPTHTTPNHPTPHKYGWIIKLSFLFKFSNQTMVWFHSWCFVCCCSVSHWVPISWICLFVCVVGWYPLTKDKQSGCCGHCRDLFWLKWVITQRNIISEWVRMVHHSTPPSLHHHPTPPRTTLHHTNMDELTNQIIFSI